MFDNRIHAGDLLAPKLEQYQDPNSVYLLAIPAGGVPVAVQMVEQLQVPWDLVLTRKLHVPWNQEAGFGAVSWEGTVLLNEPLVAYLGLSREDIDRCVEMEKQIIRRRLKKFRGNRPFPDLTGKTVIIVDDGLASGYSMLTTVKAVRGKGIKEIIVAVPTAPITAIELIGPHVEKIVCLNIRSGPIFAVADAYLVWYDLDDQDVVGLLDRAGLSP